MGGIRGGMGRRDDWWEFKKQVWNDGAEENTSGSGLERREGSKIIEDSQRKQDGGREEAGVSHQRPLFHQTGSGSGSLSSKECIKRWFCVCQIRKKLLLIKHFALNRHWNWKLCWKRGQRSWEALSPASYCMIYLGIWLNFILLLFIRPLTWSSPWSKWTE